MLFRRTPKSIEDFGIESFQRFPVTATIRRLQAQSTEFVVDEILWDRLLRNMRRNGVQAAWGVRHNRKNECVFYNHVFRDQHPSRDEIAGAALQDQLDRFVDALGEIHFSLMLHKAQLLTPDQGPGILIPSFVPYGPRGLTPAMLTVRPKPTVGEPVHLAGVPMVEGLSVKSVHVHTFPYGSTYSLELHAGSPELIRLLPEYDERKGGIYIPGLHPEADLAPVSV